MSQPRSLLLKIHLAVLPVCASGLAIGHVFKKCPKPSFSGQLYTLECWYLFLHSFQFSDTGENIAINIGVHTIWRELSFMLVMLVPRIQLRRMRPDLLSWGELCGGRDI